MDLIDFLSGEDAETKLEAQERIDGLGRVERAVLYLWVTGYTQVEIGRMFGYTQGRISQILRGINKTPRNATIDIRG